MFYIIENFMNKLFNLLLHFQFMILYKTPEQNN